MFEIESIPRKFLEGVSDCDLKQKDRMPQHSFMKSELSSKEEKVFLELKQNPFINQA